jgi:Na+-translocating ferredoxin:NAD+ oxidoreductase RnfD subunit
VTVRRFLKSPKGLLTLVFVLLVGLAAPAEGWARTGATVAAGVLPAFVVDTLIFRWRRGVWSFASGAILTGFIVAMVLSTHEPWPIVAVTSVVAILGKQLIRLHGANVFNPAALAIVATCELFRTGQDWWGALPDLPLAALVVLFATGLFIASRVNKLPMILAFLGTFSLVLTTAAFAGQAARVAGLFRTPDLHAALYFAFFILTDPPTSPTRTRDQIVCGALVGLASYATFELTGVVYYLLAGVLVGNVWEAVRRQRMRRARVTAPPRVLRPTRA